MWETAEKIGFIVLIGAVMISILRSSGELGARSPSVDRPAHVEGPSTAPQGGAADPVHAGQHGGPAGDQHGGGYAASDPQANVGRQVVILVALLLVLLALVWIGSGSLGIFWY